MSAAKKKAPVSLSVTERDVARILAAAELVSPTPMTQGDVQRFWETRATADRRYYERRARQIIRVMTLPPGEPGHYMPRERGKKSKGEQTA